MTARELEEVRSAWAARWQDALATWSRFTKLSLPRFCTTEHERREEGLTASFAMIRLTDHAVVIGLDEVVSRGLEGFGVEVLAHEVGHHVYAPGDLVDNARLLARLRKALPWRESYAPMVGNLYTDLLVNDRLQRSAGLEIAGVFRRLRVDEPGPLWAMVLRTYEVLWSLPFGDLVDERAVDTRIASDATLAARLVRVYARRWLAGAGRFGALVLPYLLEQAEAPGGVAPWMDTLQAGAGDTIPDGLASLDADEDGPAIHPADDPAIAGVDLDGYDRGEDPDYTATAAEEVGGRKNRYRHPTDYVALMKSVGVTVTEKDLVIRYYRERALGHLVPFPVRVARQSAEPLPEGLTTWETAAPLSQIDWVQSVIRSPWVIPGVTTVERTYGTTEGAEPERTPVDLYLGVDCSGSMSNPAFRESYPVIAGAVIVLSALRTGSRVKVTLSGEPGQYSSTDGFVRDERAAMGILTGYLGTGYAFGVKRLRETFLEGEPAFRRAVHLLVVTDSDFFRMLGDVEDGWDILRRANEVGGGGATLVLDRSDRSYYAQPLARVADCGWDVHHVVTQDDLVTFARAFARAHYGERRAA